MNTDRHGCLTICPEGTPQEINRGQVRTSGRGPRCKFEKSLLPRRGIAFQKLLTYDFFDGLHLYLSFLGAAVLMCLPFKLTFLP